jgi:hypothetical protein
VVDWGVQIDYALGYSAGYDDNALRLTAVPGYIVIICI